MGVRAELSAQRLLRNGCGCAGALERAAEVSQRPARNRKAQKDIEWDGVYPLDTRPLCVLTLYH